MKRIGLSGKVLLGVSLLFLLVTVATSIVSAINLNAGLTTEFQTKGTAIANSISNSSVELLLAGDGATLQAMVDEFLQIRGVGYVFVEDGDGEVVCHTFAPRIPPEVFARFVSHTAGTAGQDRHVNAVTIEGMGDYLDVTAPILSGLAGVVHVGMDLKVIRADVRSAVFEQDLAMLAIFAVSMMLAYVHVTRVAKPLGVLTSHANQVASLEGLREREQSDAEIPTSDVAAQVAKLAEHPGDEVGDLAAAFQHMETELRHNIDNLRRAHLELAEYNRTLEEKVNARTHELREKNGELESTMTQLKAAQDQVVVSEKMASLGALTAGIAHEIKNPLNFINNFADVAGEIAQELIDAVAKMKAGDPDVAEDMEESAQTLQTNVRKIHEHGKRADAIVKNMLLHSRTKAGEFQQVDVNSLLDQYVSLAYHGLRAQDSSFNATIDKHYDPTVGEALMVQQDLSRAFLNVLTNACYALHDKKKAAGAGYSPTLSISTRVIGAKIQARIRDNGDGIPQEIRDKIFNPFFTTKPAGSGTGLGLSMTYDIVVRQHKGEIQVESEPGAFTEFILTIPRDPEA